MSENQKDQTQPETAHEELADRGNKKVGGDIYKERSSTTNGDPIHYDYSREYYSGADEFH